MKRKMSMWPLSITILMISLARVQSASVTMSMPQISKMDVQCSRSGMTVDVEFDLPFDGIIFSKGHFSDPACRFVEKGSNRNQYSFSIPAGGCGTTDSDLGSRSNILIFQFDPILQEIWDSSRQVSCRSAEKVTKYVTWKPLTVDMLDVKQGNGQDVDCWMDILKGTYPLTKPIDGNVKIGEELSLVIYLKDPNGNHDVAVRDCWAYDDSEIDAQSTLKVQLTTTDGCAKKPKLMHFWRQTSQVGDSTATLITYSNITAFRFPSSNGQVYFTCSVDVCEGSCFKKDCLGEESYVNEVTSKAPVTTVRPVTTSARIVLQTLPYPIPETTPTPYRPIPVETTTTPTPYSPIPIETTTTPPDCSKGSLDERCPSTRPPISIPNCVTNPRDPRCPELETTTAPINCYPGNSDPRCPTTTSRAPPTTTTPFTAFKITSDAPYSSTPKSFVCLPGSTDPSCPRSATTPRSCNPDSSDSECPPPSIITTPRPIVCFPGNKDPRCPITPCAPGSIDCEEPEDCIPGTNDPRCPTSAPLVCVPGSKDPRCPQPLTEAPPPTCNPGSRDPRCPTTTTRRTTVRTTTSKTEGEPEGKEATTRKSGGKGWEGADPRYHAFHSWLYQPAPKPRGSQTKTVENA